MEKKKKILLLVGGAVFLVVIAIIMMILGYFLFLKPTGCEYNGEVYDDEEQFEAKDGCNVCSCNNGEVVCTEMACDFPEDDFDLEDFGDSELNGVSQDEESQNEEKADKVKSGSFQDFEYVWYEDDYDYVKFKYPDNWDVDVDSGVFDDGAGTNSKTKTFEGIKTIELNYDENYAIYLYPLTGHGIGCLDYDVDKQVVYAGGDTVGEEGRDAWYLSKSPSITNMQINRGGEKLNFEWLNFSRDIIESQGSENTEERKNYTYDGEFSYIAKFAMESTDNTYCNSIVFKDFPGKPILGGNGEWDYTYLADVEDPNLDLVYSDVFKSKEDFKTYIEILETFLETAERKKF